MADLRSLQPWLQPWARWISDYGKSIDPRLVVTSARRSTWDQIRLYDNWISGRSSIPAAPPGRSKHELGEAFDMARIGIDPLEDPLLPFLGSWWQYYGGLFGGDKDPVHFGVR